MFFRRVLAVASSALCLVGSVNAIAVNSASGISNGVDIETNVGGFFVAPFSSNAFSLTLKGRDDAANIALGTATLNSTKIKSGGGVGLFAEFLPESLSPIFLGASVSYEKIDSSGSGTNSSTISDGVVRGEVMAGVIMSATESLDIYVDGRFGIASHNISSTFASDSNDSVTGLGSGSFSGLSSSGYSTGIGAGVRFKFGETSSIALGYQYSLTSAVPATKAGASGMSSSYTYYTAGTTTTTLANSVRTTTEFTPGIHLFKLAISTRISSL